MARGGSRVPRGTHAGGRKKKLGQCPGQNAHAAFPAQKPEADGFDETRRMPQIRLRQGFAGLRISESTNLSTAHIMVATSNRR